MRHGELKQLRALKKEYHSSGPRNKKVLKLDEMSFGDGEDKEDAMDDGSIDIKDVDFRMRNDASQLKSLLRKSTAYGHEDITMLKIILVSGFYPQFAIPDDFNKHKVFF